MSDRTVTADPSRTVHLAMVGAGPAGIAIGAEARRDSRGHGVRIVRHPCRRLRPAA